MPRKLCIDKANTTPKLPCMDIHFEKNGVSFAWNEHKAISNKLKHEGISFEQATAVFFDPFLKLVDASIQSTLK